MKRVNKHKGKFWSGFAMGTLTAMAFSHFITDKEHRGYLKKFLEYLDHEDDALKDPNHFLYLAQTYITDQQKSTDLNEPSQKIEETSRHLQVDSILEKMQHAFNDKKQVKKYFVKEGKIINK